MQLHLIYFFKCPIPGIATFREENFHVPAWLVMAAAAVVWLYHLLGFCWQSNDKEVLIYAKVS